MYIILEESKNDYCDYNIFAYCLFEDLQDVEEFLKEDQVTSEVIVASVTPKYRMYGVQHLTIKKEAV